RCAAKSRRARRSGSRPTRPRRALLECGGGGSRAERRSQQAGSVLLLEVELPPDALAQLLRQALARERARLRRLVAEVEGEDQVGERDRIGQALRDAHFVAGADE